MTRRYHLILFLLIIVIFLTVILFLVIIVLFFLERRFLEMGRVCMGRLGGGVFGFLLALHSSFGELFHHFDKFLAIVFEKIVGDGKDAA